MINLETEIVESRYDTKARANIYVIARNGRRWTVSVPDADVAKIGGNKQARRVFVTNMLETAMRGKADGEA